MWYLVMPCVLMIGYWALLQRMDADATWWQLTALPNPIFDWWFYVQILASDLMDGTHVLFHGLGFFVAPTLRAARSLVPHLTYAELYFFGLVVSFVASLWLFAVLFRVAAKLGTAEARTCSIIVFLCVEAVLGLRPGASSWYVPFFLVGLIALFLAEDAWETHHRTRAIGLTFAALLFGLAYPWYFLCLATTAALLIAHRFLTWKIAAILLAAGAVVAAVVIGLRDAWLPVVLASHTLESMARGGIGFSHLPVASNTIVAIGAWWIAWLLQAKRSRSATMLLAWTALGVLWLQNTFTGAAITPDHFIYATWILSALSWGMWPSASQVLKGGRSATFLSAAGLAAAAYAALVLYRILFVYDLSSVGGVMIHVGIWTFLALGLLSTARASARGIIAGFFVGILLTTVGLIGSIRFADFQRADMQAYLGFLAWVKPDADRRDLTWCSDWNAEQLLAANAGLKIRPNTVALLDPVPTASLQEEQIDIAAFFHALGTDQGWRIERQLLFSEDLLCDLNQRARTILPRFISDERRRTFLIGCDQTKADAERRAITKKMEDRWNAPLPETSAVCDRFIVRSELQDYWRIPASYPPVYRDTRVTVYGRR